MEESKFEESESSIRAAAVEKCHGLARTSVMKTIRKALPKCECHPQDIKALLHPVDYLVFCGMTEGSTIDRIVLLSTETEDKILKRVRPSIEQTISRQEYDWNVARVLDDGCVKLK